MVRFMNKSDQSVRASIFKNVKIKTLKLKNLMIPKFWTSQNPLSHLA